MNNIDSKMTIKYSRFYLGKMRGKEMNINEEKRCKTKTKIDDIFDENIFRFLNFSPLVC